MHIAVNVIKKNSLLRSVLGCQCVVIKQRIRQTNARNRTKIRHRTKVILIAVAAVGMYKYANWSGNGLPVSLVQQVGQEKFSNGDHEPEEETSAGLPNNRLMTSWPLRGGCWWDSKELQSGKVIGDAWTWECGISMRESNSQLVLSLEIKYQNLYGF